MTDVLVSISTSLINGLLFVYDAICGFPNYVLGRKSMKAMMSTRIKVGTSAFVL